MDFMEVIYARKAIRKYKRDEIPEVKLQRLFEALSVAPSGMNQQPYKFFFVKDDKLHEALFIYKEYL